MDEYLMLLILAYFKQYGQEYSLGDLKERVGVTLIMLDRIIETMIHDGLLCVQNNLILLSQKGRMRLAISEMEPYNYWQDEYELALNEKRWPTDKIYPIHNFSKFKWRGSE